MIDLRSQLNPWSELKFYLVKKENIFFIYFSFSWRSTCKYGSRKLYVISWQFVFCYCISFTAYRFYMSRKLHNSNYKHLPILNAWQFLVWSNFKSTSFKYWAFNVHVCHIRVVSISLTRVKGISWTFEDICQFCHNPSNIL